MGDLYHFEIIPTYEIGTSDCQKGDPKMGHDCDHYQSHEHLENVLEETFRHIFQVIGNGHSHDPSHEGIFVENLNHANL